MKSFQNKHRGYKSLESKKCVHGRYSLKYLKNPTLKVNQQPRNPKEQKRNIIEIQSQPDDAHSLMMKSIIAKNEEYFQNKLQISNDGKPNKLKLKIPSKTGFTVYKRDYIKNMQDQPLLKGQKPNFKQNKIDPVFFGNTTYRNQFLGVQNQHQNDRHKTSQSVDPNAPFFLETQYKHNYLNWGGGCHMPSMKPDPNPAVTNLTFQTSSVYSTQFTNKPHHKTQLLKPNNTLVGFCNKGNSAISNQLSSPLSYMTTNSLFYDKKQNSKQNSLRPTNQTMKVGGNQFKGKTQYQSQFIHLKGSTMSCSNKKTLGELQNLIINL